MNKPHRQTIFSINHNDQFDMVALQIFQHQAQHCTVYKEFIAGLKINPANVKTIEQIPFLPIEFFKTHSVISTNDPVQVTFTSSGTTGITTSSHFVTDVSWYEESFR